MQPTPIDRGTLPVLERLRSRPTVDLGDKKARIEGLMKSALAFGTAWERGGGLAGPRQAPKTDGGFLPPVFGRLRSPPTVDLGGNRGPKGVVMEPCSDIGGQGNGRGGGRVCVRLPSSTEPRLSPDLTWPCTNLKTTEGRGVHYTGLAGPPSDMTGLVLL
ncbi:unnamed protein product [Calypogeia fissa]